MTEYQDGGSHGNDSPNSTTQSIKLMTLVLLVTMAALHKSIDFVEPDKFANVAQACNFWGEISPRTACCGPRTDPFQHCQHFLHVHMSEKADLFQSESASLGKEPGSIFRFLTIFYFHQSIIPTGPLVMIVW